VATDADTSADQRSSIHQSHLPGDDEVSYFEEMWQRFSGEMDAGDWNYFLSDLDSRFRAGQV
jgi:hypothetical protein